MNKLQSILAFIGFLFAAAFLGYRKGKSDSKSEQIKDMLKESQKEKEELQKINDLKNENEKLSDDELISSRNKL